MPALISHRLAGEKALPEIERTVGLKLDKSCFYWGCQGPDVLFYSIPRPTPVNSYARKLHRARPEELFLSLRDFVKENESGKGFLLSYALGMCCHYALDRTAHPYILWLCGELERADGRPVRYNRHANIELNLDVMLLLRDKGVTPRDFLPGSCLSRSETAMAAVSLTIRRLLHDLFGREISVRQGLSLCDDMLRGIILLEDRFGVKRPAMLMGERALPRLSLITGHTYPMTADLSVDYANLAGKQWCSPLTQGEESRENYFELYEHAVRFSEALCQYFIYSLQNDELDFTDITEGKTFFGAPVYE